MHGHVALEYNAQWLYCENVERVQRYEGCFKPVENVWSELHIKRSTGRENEAHKSMGTFV